MNRPLPWHEEPWQRLRQRRERGAMPHALMLQGPAGLGKRDFSDRLQNALLCEACEDGNACGHCRACRLLQAGTHPDRYRVSLEERSDGVLRKEIVVQQIRVLAERLSKASQFGGWQLAVIDPADAMNAAAANALLKTLEEPGERRLLILVADAPWRLPATIRSRCHLVQFRLPEAQSAVAWLQSVGVADADDALQAASGNPGLALRWFEDGLLDERQRVGDDLRSLAAGQGNAGAVAGAWADEHAGQRLWFAASLVAEELRQRAEGGRGMLQSRLSARGLSAWFTQANRARTALDGPLRKDLLLLELLTAWR